MIERKAAETAELPGLEVGTLALVTLYFQEGDYWIPTDSWCGQIRPNPLGYEGDIRYANVMPDEPRGEEPYSKRHPLLVNRVQPFPRVLCDGRQVWLRHRVEIVMPPAVELE